MELKAVNLTKKYDNGKGIQDINFQMHEGIYALLGPNGAGKSTLIRVLTGLQKMSSGQVLWNNQDTKTLGRHFCEKIGYAPQSVTLYNSFTAKRYLAYIAGLKGMKKQEAKKEISEILERLELAEVANRRIETFSGGMKQRLLVAQAMIGSPKLLILDEPASGLDPGQRIILRNLIKEIAEDKIVILATHIVADIEYLADEILFLKDGELVQKGSRDEILCSINQKIGNLVCKNLEDAYLHIYNRREKLYD